MELTEIIKDIVGISAPKASTNFSILFRCANLVASNVAVNYKDCITTQTFNVTDKKIDFTEFEKTCLKIKSVKMSGQEIQYDLFMNRLTVPNGKITVEYAYIPKFIDSEEEVAAVMGRIDENVLLYGIVAEYACISGMKFEAKTFTDKFENLVTEGLYTGRARQMPWN